MKNIITLALVVFLFVSCSDNSSDSDPQDETMNVKIGVITAETGSGESVGQASKQAILMSETSLEDELSEELGKNVEVELVFQDSETKPEVGLEKIKYLHQEGINIVIGPTSSATTKEIVSYAKENDILLINYSSIASSLANADDNLIRLIPDHTHQAKAMAKLLNNAAIKKLSILYRDDVWGNELSASITEEYEKTGGEVFFSKDYITDSDQQFHIRLSMLDTLLGSIGASSNYEAYGLVLLSFSEGIRIMESAKNFKHLPELNWYGSSGIAGNEDLVINLHTREFASERLFKCPVYYAAAADESIRTELDQKLGRTAEEYAYVAYDALEVAVRTYLENESSGGDLEETAIGICNSITGITGKLSLNDSGDRSFGNYEILMVKETGGEVQWVQYGIYNSQTDEIELF